MACIIVRTLCALARLKYNFLKGKYHAATRPLSTLHIIIKGRALKTEDESIEPFFVFFRQDICQPQKIWNKR